MSGSIVWRSDGPVPDGRPGYDWNPGRSIADPTFGASA
jgi:hypothetical protein